MLLLVVFVPILTASIQVQSANSDSSFEQDFYEACFHLQRDEILNMIRKTDGVSSAAFSHVKAIELVLEGSPLTFSDVEIEKDEKDGILEILIQHAVDYGKLLDLRSIDSGSTEDVAMLTRKIQFIYNTDHRAATLTSTLVTNYRILLVPTVCHLESLGSKYFNEYSRVPLTSLEGAVEHATDISQITESFPGILARCSDHMRTAFLKSGIFKIFEILEAKSKWLSNSDLILVMKSSNPSAVQIIKTFIERDQRTYFKRSSILKALRDASQDGERGILEIYHTATVSMLQLVRSEIGMFFDLSEKVLLSNRWMEFLKVLKGALPSISRQNRDPNAIWYILNMIADVSGMANKLLNYESSVALLLTMSLQEWIKTLQNYLIHVCQDKRPKNDLIKRLDLIQSSRWYTAMVDDERDRALGLIFDGNTESDPIIMAICKKRFGIAYHLLGFLDQHKNPAITVVQLSSMVANIVEEMPQSLHERFLRHYSL